MSASRWHWTTVFYFHFDGRNIDVWILDVELTDTHSSCSTQNSPVSTLHTRAKRKTTWRLRRTVARSSWFLITYNLLRGHWGGGAGKKNYKNRTFELFPMDIQFILSTMMVFFTQYLSNCTFDFFFSLLPFSKRMHLKKKKTKKFNSWNVSDVKAKIPTKVPSFYVFH